MRCASVHLTDLCNERCSFCVVGSPLFVKDTVKRADVLQFLSDCAKLGCDVVNLHGGEPTIAKGFLELLDCIGQIGFSGIHLQTNGLTLADPEFAAACVDRKVSLFIVSLHGSEPAIHEEQIGTPGGFRRTTQGIRNVVALGSSVRTNTVVTRQNCDDLLRISRLCIDLGVDHINFSNLHPVGSSVFSAGLTMPSFSTVKEGLYSAIDLATVAGKRVTLEGYPYCWVKERVARRLENEYRDIRMLFRGSVLTDYDEFMEREMRTYGPPCQTCAVQSHCGGVYPQYVQRFGWSEASPVSEAEARISYSDCGSADGDR